MGKQRDRIDALVEAFQKPPYNRYKNWEFDYEYPGFFVYYHQILPLALYFTPGHTHENEIDFQINWEDEPIDAGQAPFYSDSPEELFTIVKQWMDFIEDNITISKKGQGVLDWTPEKIPWIRREDR